MYEFNGCSYRNMPMTRLRLHLGTSYGGSIDMMGCRIEDLHRKMRMLFGLEKGQAHGCKLYASFVH